jgi:DNA invertase Pin-like site-specific DNA recombinase
MQKEREPQMNRIGYARASSLDQDTAVQVEALTKAGCGVIRQEKASGTTTTGRPELVTVLQFLQKGDALVVTRIDRLARSVADLETIVKTIKDRGATLECTEQPVNTGTPAGKAFLQMLGVFAEFETALRKERQLEGIAKAKAEGIYTGRKPVLDPAKIRQLAEAGTGPTEIAKQLKISRSSVYRLRDEQTAA